LRAAFPLICRFHQINIRFRKFRTLAQGLGDEILDCARGLGFDGLEVVHGDDRHSFKHRIVKTLG
jgi:hypothetical protein